MAQLGIQRGKSRWLLQCDALVSHADGGVLDALGIATRAALAHCRIPKVTVAFGPDPNDPAELELDDDPSAMTALDVSNVPLIVSVTEVGRRVILDASGAEEAVAGATLHVAVDAAGRVRGASMGGRGAVDVARAREMTAVAREAGKRLIAAIDRRVRIAEAEAEARGVGRGARTRTTRTTSKTWTRAKEARRSGIDRSSPGGEATAQSVRVRRSDRR